MKNFTDRFNEALALRGMKQIDIARKTGIAPGTISNYAVGKYAPKDDKLTAIAEALGVSEAYLCGYSDDPAPTGDAGLDGFLDRFIRSTQPGSFGPVTVSAKDLELLAAFHEADPMIQSVICKLLDIEGDQE